MQNACKSRINRQKAGTFIVIELQSWMAMRSLWDPTYAFQTNHLQCWTHWTFASLSDRFLLFVKDLFGFLVGFVSFFLSYVTIPYTFTEFMNKKSNKNSSNNNNNKMTNLCSIYFYHTRNCANKKRRSRRKLCTESMYAEWITGFRLCIRNIEFHLLCGSIH